LDFASCCSLNHVERARADRNAVKRDDADEQDEAAERGDRLVIFQAAVKRSPEPQRPMSRKVG